MNYINSKENNFFKLVKSLEKKKYRYLNDLVIFESVKGISHCLKNNIYPEYLILNEMILENTKAYSIFKNTEISDSNKYIFSVKLFNEISETVNSQGIISLFSMQNFIKKDLEKFNKEFDTNILILDRIQDPGNLGTIIRNCDAFGIKDILLTKGSVDFSSSKVIRASMGSFFNINFYNVENDFILNLEEKGFLIVPTSPYAKRELSDYRFQKNKNAIVLGNESIGVSNFFDRFRENALKIKMINQESLNVAVSSAVILYKLQF